MRTVISLIQALLFIISSFSVQDSDFKFRVDRAAYDIAATSEISFEALDASSYDVTAVLTLQNILRCSSIPMQKAVWHSFINAKM